MIYLDPFLLFDRAVGGCLAEAKSQEILLKSLGESGIEDINIDAKPLPFEQIDQILIGQAVAKSF